jgi:O-antigen/teichoic acid export membrane protein
LSAGDDYQESLPAVPDPAAHTTGKAVARGGLWNFASRGLPQFFLLFASIAAARALGPTSFGRQSFIAFVEVAAVMLVTAGLPTAMIRYVGDALGRRDFAAARGLAGWAWRLELLPALLVGAGLAAIGAAGAEPRLAWVLAGIAAAAGVLARVPMSFLNGLQRWREVSIIGLAVTGLGAAVTVVVLLLGGKITAMFAVDAAATLAMLAVLAWIGRKRSHELGSEVYAPPELRRAAFRFALVASVGVVLTFIIWRRFEFFFLNRFSTEAEIGFYSIAFAAAAVPVVLFQGLTGVVAAAVSTLLGAGARGRIRGGTGRAVRLLLLAALPTTAAALALGPPLVRLVYGSGFEGSTQPLVILLLVLPIVPLVSLASALLGGVGRLGVNVAAGVVASGVDVGLSFLLIPDHGATGAALANDAAQLAVGIPVMVYAWRIVGSVDWRPGTVARTSCASIVAGLIAWGCVRLFGDAYGVLAGVVLGAAAFLSLASLLRIVAHDDARWLEQAGGRVMAGRMGWLIRSWAAPQPGVRPL